MCMVVWHEEAELPGGAGEAGVGFKDEDGAEDWKVVEMEEGVKVEEMDWM